MSMNNNNQNSQEVRPTLDELRKKELNDSINAAERNSMTQRLVIKTEDGSLLNNMFLKRKKQTLSMFKVPVAFYKRVGEYGPFKKQLKFIKLAESRLTRFFEANKITVPKNTILPLKNGETIEATAEYTFNELVGNPIIFVEFVGKPMFEDMLQAQAYEECKSFIHDGFRWKYQGEEICTEYAQSSASEMRTLKGVFVRKDFKFSEEYLSKFSCNSEDPMEIAAFDTFVNEMKNLRGAEVLYTAMSYGAYLSQYRGSKDSPAKFMARMGMSQTSTKTLGNDFKVKCIGEIRTIWNAEIEHQFVEYYSNLKNNDGSSMFSEKRVIETVAKIKDFWKAEKIDGQSIISDEAAIRGFKNLGIKLNTEKVLGRLIQARWAGVKGTFLVVPKSWMDRAELTDGTHPYAGYDMVVEKSSWKYTPWVKYWNGALAPELELVAISKQKYSSNMNYQFMLALDGDGNREIKTVDKLKALVDGRYAFAVDVMQSPDVAKAALGMKSANEEEADDMLDIDDYERSLTTILAKALDACDEIIYDRSWRLKYINRLTKMRDKMGYGKVPVEGANRFVISDPVPFFRTDLAVPRINKDGTPELDYEGNPMFDIEITSMNQSAIQNIVGAFWSDKDAEAVLFRSPCNHPGEPQRVTLHGINSLPETVSTSYGDLNTSEIFGYIKDIVVINVYSSILDCLGGADTDGDTVLVVTEPAIVELRSLKRAPMLAKVSAGTHKDIISPKAIKKYMANSLEDAGIGRITNWGTTWRDIELMVVHMPNPVDGKYRLPAIVKDALEYAVKKAKAVLKTEVDNLSPVEKAAAVATAAIEFINNDKEFSKWAKLVITACEANIELVRTLQETAINTAKSGVFVEFGKYTWLKIKVRATWHRPWASDTYDSWSTMGQLSTYSDEKWDKLRDWAGETSKPLNIGSDLDWPALREVYRVIRELKAEFGSSMYEISKKAAAQRAGSEDYTEDEIRAEYKELGIFYNSILRTIAVELGSVDSISAMVYRATIDRDKDNDDGLSFVWQCWGEEFVHTLRHMNSNKASKRLVAVRMAKGYEDYTLLPGEYIVEAGGIRSFQVPDSILAHAKVPDGNYELITFDEVPYLLMHVTKKTVESMAASFKGVRLPIIGIKYHMYDGVTLNRDKAKELLAMAGYTITVVGGEAGSSGGETYIDALVTVTIPGVENPICIGNIPSGGGSSSEAGYFSQALHNKVIRILIPKDADKLDKNKSGQSNRLSIEIAEILEDLSL